MSFESEYKLEKVAATPVAADEIDATFRSSTIGQLILMVARVSLRQCGGQDSWLSVLGSEARSRDSGLLVPPEPVEPPPSSKDTS